LGVAFGQAFHFNLFARSSQKGFSFQSLTQTFRVFFMMIFKMLRALPSARLFTAIFLVVPLKKDFRCNP
jgi:hypothetical protein